MPSDKRTGWLADLTVGERVVMRPTNGPMTLTTVVAISPSGQITTATGARFTPSGRLVGSTSGWSWTSLSQAGDKTLARIARQDAVSSIRHAVSVVERAVNGGKMTDEQVRDVAVLLSKAVEVIRGA